MAVSPYMFNVGALFDHETRFTFYLFGLNQAPGPVRPEPDTLLCLLSSDK